MATKVLIVDDHPAVREGLAIRVASQPDLEVCGQAADTAEALKLLEAVRPDVVVVDIQLQTGNGLDLVERITARDESIGILVWSMYPDRIYAQRRSRPAPWVTSTSSTRPTGWSRRFAAFATERYSSLKKRPSNCWAMRSAGANI